MYKLSVAASTPLHWQSRGVATETEGAVEPKIVGPLQNTWPFTEKVRLPLFCTSCALMGHDFKVHQQNVL